MQVETAAVTYVENENGVRMVIQTGDYIRVNTPGKGTLFRLLGTRGFIEFWGWEPSYFILSAEHPNGETVTPAESLVTGHQCHLELLARQIAEGKADYRLAGASQMALEICEAAFLSHKYRCQVNFPLADFTPPPASDWELGRPYPGHGGGRDGRALA
jgi:predicted dehydrogenase